MATLSVIDCELPLLHLFSTFQDKCFIIHCEIRELKKIPTFYQIVTSKITKFQVICSLCIELWIFCAVQNAQSPMKIKFFDIVGERWFMLDDSKCRQYSHMVVTVVIDDVRRRYGRCVIYCEKCRCVIYCEIKLFLCFAWRKAIKTGS